MTPEQWGMDLLMKAEARLRGQANGLRNLAIKEFKALLEQKLHSVREKPLQILKRLEAHVYPMEEPPKLISEAILVRYFMTELRVEKERIMAKHKEGGDEDDDDVKSQKSRKSGKSRKTKGGKSKKGKASSMDIGIYEPGEDQNYEALFTIYQESFRISKVSELPNVKQAVCDHF